MDRLEKIKRDLESDPSIYAWCAPSIRDDVSWLLSAAEAAERERDAARRELEEVRGRVDRMKETELWIARYLSEYCQTHCPINKRYGNLPNPEACEVPEVCPTKDIWVMLRNTAIEPGGGE